jgi:hypothetical protein
MSRGGLGGAPLPHDDPSNAKQNERAALDDYCYTFPVQPMNDLNHIRHPLKSARTG